MNTINRALALNYIRMTIVNLLGFLLVPILISSYGDTQYGLYILVVSFVTSFFVERGGPGSSVTRDIAEYARQGEYAKANKVFFAAIPTYIAMTVITSIICYISVSVLLYYGEASYDFLTISEVWKLYLTMMGSIILGYMVNFLCTVTIGFQDLVTFQISQLVKMVIRFILLVSCAHLSLDIIWLIRVECFVFLLVVVILLWNYIRKYYRRAESGLDIIISKKSLTLKIVGMTFVMLFCSICGKLSSQLLVISDSVSIAGLFSVAYLFYSVFSQLTTTIGGFYLHEVGDAVASDDLSYINLRLRRLARPYFVLLCVVAFGFFAIGKLVLDIFGGPLYTQMYTLILIWMAISVYPLSCIGMNEFILIKNKWGYMMIVPIIQAVVAVGINWWFITRFGLAGAFYAAFVAVGLFNYICNFGYLTYLGIDVKGHFLSLVGRMIPCVAIATLVTFMCQRLSPWFPVLTATLGVLSFLGTVYFWYLEPSERTKVRKFLKVGEPYE